jgi:hypothetical protein
MHWMVRFVVFMEWIVEVVVFMECTAFRRAIDKKKELKGTVMHGPDKLIL